jgi:hypothetical protein
MSTSPLTPNIVSQPPVTTPPPGPTSTPPSQPIVGKQTVQGKQVKWTNTAPSNDPSQKKSGLTLRSGVSRQAMLHIYKEVGVKQLKPLTPQQKQQVDAMVTQLKANQQIQQKKLVEHQKNNQGKINLAKMTGQDPATVKLEPAPTKLSDSALLLKDKLAKSVSTGPKDERNIIASAVIDSLGLKDGEEVSDAHIAKAKTNLARFEKSRGTELFQAFGPKTYALLLKGVMKATEKAGPEYAGSIAKLNDNQLCALHCYTEQVYCDRINLPLRTGETLEPKYQKAMDIALGAMKLLPPFVGLVYRGCSLPEKIDETLVTGGEFRDKAFISSAASKDAAFKGTHQFVIASSTGRDISFVSALSHEKEILFPPSTGFYVFAREGTVPFGPDGKPSVGGNTEADGWGACKAILHEKS